jgi:hypothetical protein
MNKEILTGERKAAERIFIEHLFENLSVPPDEELKEVLTLLLSGAWNAGVNFALEQAITLFERKLDSDAD